MPARRATSSVPGDVAAAFDRCAAHVDLAQRAMVRCVPSSPRVAALPAAVGAETMRVALADAAAEMPGWRHQPLEGVWLHCETALRDTLAALDATITTLTSTRELEVALTAVADLLAPLEAFADAERAVRAISRTSR